MSRSRKKKRSQGFYTTHRFPERSGEGWNGPVVDYKEIELLRKFLTTSAKMMSRKRAGTSAQEQKDLKQAIKQARYMALLPYISS